jgi:putative hydrolase of the HAD superfamily
MTALFPPIEKDPDARCLPDDPARIRCIALDAVGTLIQPVPSAAEVYHLAAERHGSRLSGEEIARRFRRVFRETERGDSTDPRCSPLATSDTAERERWREIVTKVIDDIADPERCFDELFAHFARPESWRAFDDAPAALDRLRRAGKKLVLASNFDGRLHAVCDGLPAMRALTCRVISAEIGYRKPSPHFFEALIARSGCRAVELLMVGDDRENDWEGARRSGIDAVLINRRGECGPHEIASLGELARWVERQ